MPVWGAQRSPKQPARHIFVANFSPETFFVLVFAIKHRRAPYCNIKRIVAPATACICTVHFSIVMNEATVVGRIRKKTHTHTRLCCVYMRKQAKKCTVCASHMCSINRIAHKPHRRRLFFRCAFQTIATTRTRELCSQNMSSSVYWHCPHHAAHSGSTRSSHG